MKCKQCVEQYLNKTRKLLDIKEVFVITEEQGGYCAKHWFSARKNTDKYSKMCLNDFQAQQRQQIQTAYHSSSSGLYNALGGIFSWWR